MELFLASCCTQWICQIHFLLCINLMNSIYYTNTFLWCHTATAVQWLTIALLLHPRVVSNKSIKACVCIGRCTLHIWWGHALGSILGGSIHAAVRNWLATKFVVAVMIKVPVQSLCWQDVAVSLQYGGRLHSATRTNRGLAHNTLPFTSFCVYLNSQCSFLAGNLSACLCPERFLLLLMICCS